VRAVVMDLDGTVLDSTFLPSQRTVAAVAAAEAAGIACLIATGRMLVSARRIAEILGVRRPLICYQGAMVGDPVTGEILLHVPLPAELACEILVALGDDASRTNVYVDDELYVSQDNPEAERYAHVAGVTMHVVGPLAEWLKQPTTKLVTVGEAAHLDAVRDRMLEQFGARAFIAKSLPIFLEFAAPGVSKAYALEIVAQRTGFTAAETVAFGDGENDRELLEWAGTGIAVDGGSERLREVADWVVPSVHEDGVARALEALVAGRR
jgi:Cof subfamily protein (haloacid dehalogenase superfamily)